MGGDKKPTFLEIQPWLYIQAFRIETWVQ